MHDRPLVAARALALAVDPCHRPPPSLHAAVLPLGRHALVVRHRTHTHPLTHDHRRRVRHAHLATRTHRPVGLGRRRPAAAAIAVRGLQATQHQRLGVAQIGHAERVAEWVQTGDDGRAGAPRLVLFGRLEPSLDGVECACGRLAGCVSQRGEEGLVRRTGGREAGAAIDRRAVLAGGGAAGRVGLVVGGGSAHARRLTHHVEVVIRVAMLRQRPHRHPGTVHELLRKQLGVDPELHPLAHTVGHGGHALPLVDEVGICRTLLDLLWVGDGEGPSSHGEGGPGRGRRADGWKLVAEEVASDVRHGRGRPQEVGGRGVERRQVGVERVGRQTPERGDGRGR
mmetsp:Transcript_6405/g.15455  ORF Transcript_6405/g.15455 Transcript_6405/m.15455 type:complete len:340 (-) Transcript_6405:113-1132(-)